MLAAVHVKHITDLAWSPDGRYLVASSHDGYCTVVCFEAGELGEPLEDHQHDAMSVRAEMAKSQPAFVRLLKQAVWMVHECFWHTCQHVFVMTEANRWLAHRSFMCRKHLKARK